MKLLSQMTTDESLDAMCVVAPRFQNILDDKELIDELAKKLPKGEHSQIEIYRFAMSRIFVLLPVVMKNHREDVYNILSAFTENTAEECGKQNILKTMGQVRKLLKDEALMDFFASASGSAQSA